MSVIRLNRSALNELLQSKHGPVVKDLMRRGVRVQNRTRQNLRGAGATGLRAFDFGTLTNSISHEFLIVQRFPTVRVGANTFYALWIHEGTSRMKPRPYLREALNAAK